MGVGANSNSLGGYIQKDVDEAKNVFDFTVKAIKTKIPTTGGGAQERDQGGRQSDHPREVEGRGHDDQVPRPEPAHRQRAQADRDGLRPRHGPVQGKSFFEAMRTFASKGCPFEDEFKDAVKGPKAAKKALATVNLLAQRACGVLTPAQPRCRGGSAGSSRRGRGPSRRTGRRRRPELRERRRQRRLELAVAAGGASCGALSTSIVRIGAVVLHVRSRRR